MVRESVLLASLVHVRADLTAHRVARNPSLVKCFRMHVWHAIRSSEGTISWKPKGVGCGFWGQWMGSTYDYGEVGLTGVFEWFRRQTWVLGAFSLPRRGL